MTFLLLQSCSTLKVSKLLKKGSVENTEFLEEIPFSYVNNLIFIDVVINGNSYNFIFDTGAEISVIGEHIKNEVDYKNVTSYAVETSTMTSVNQEFVALEDLTVGSVLFERTGAAIMDISHFDAFFGCRTVDGILGNNLMRKAAWQVDYQNKKIILSDDISKIKISDTAQKLNLDKEDYRNVYVDLVIDGVASTYTFDTGYNGTIKSDSTLLNEFKAANADLQYISQEGWATTNVNGRVTGKTYKALGEDIQMEGGILIANQEINFGDQSSALVGNKIFEHYTITLDWDNNAFFLDQKKDFIADDLSFREFYFSPNYQTLQIEITNIVNMESASEPVSLDSEILAINGVDVSSFTLEELCDYWNEKGSKLGLSENISILILDKGEKREIQLNRKVLAP